VAASKLLGYIDSVATLKNILTTFKKHKALETQVVDGIYQKLADALNKSTVLRGYVTTVTVSQVKQNVKIHGDNAFFKAHLRNAAAAMEQKRGEDPTVAWEAKIAAAAMAEETMAFVDTEGMIYLRKGDPDLVTGIHELIHKVCFSDVKAQLGLVLNEAMTEFIARLVCQENGIDNTMNQAVYEDEMAVLLAVVKEHGLKTKDVLDFYFKTPKRLADLIADEFETTSDFNEFRNAADARVALELYEP